MPTPFTHLAIATRLLNDPALPEDVRSLLTASLPAYWLGSVVADARPTPDADRETTHFYRYDRPMQDHPWRVMMQQNPGLMSPGSEAHRAFVAAYVAHLATDEYWSRYMLKPYFAQGDWGDGLRDRFFVLHFLLVYMDERDLADLPVSIPRLMKQCEPDNWLPFIPDRGIREWRDFIVSQIPDHSQTLEIFGNRIQHPPHAMREKLDSTEWMQSRLWQHISPQLLQHIEDEMYSFAREQMCVYVREMRQQSFSS